MSKSFFCLLLFLSIYSLTYVQTHGQALIKNYQGRDYAASISNWDLIQGNDQTLFVANLEGVVAFQPPTWHVTPIDGVTSIAKDEDNRIYYGTNSDFGYLTADSTGSLKSISLLSTYLPNEKAGFIWDIVYCNGLVYFYSKQKLFTWDGQNLSTIEPEANSTFTLGLFCEQDRPYLLHSKHGLVSVDKKKVQPVKGTTSLTQDILIEFSKKDSTASIGTRFSGFYILKNDSLILDKQLTLDNATANIFSLASLQSGEYAIGTLSDGLIVTDTNLNKVTAYNEYNGLQSNSVKNLWVDNANNIWAALQEGLAYIEHGSPLKKIDPSNEVSGIITSLVADSSQLFIGTTEGLYRYYNEVIQEVNAIKAPVWQLNNFPKEDLVTIASAKGLYINQPNKLSRASTDLLFPAVYNYTNTRKVILAASGIFLVLNKNIPNFTNMQELLQVDESWVDASIGKNHSIWASAKFKGIYHITFDENGQPQTTLYNTDHGLPDVDDIHMIKHDGHQLFTTSGGLYHYDATNPDSTKFMPFDGNLQPKGHIKLAVKDSLGNFYFTIQKENRIDRLEKFELQADERFKRVYKPFKRLPDMEITALYPAGDSMLWIAGSEGLYQFDQTKSKNYTVSFNTLISIVSTNDSLLFGGFYKQYKEGNEVPFLTLEQPAAMQPTLTYENNNLTFEFGATYYEAPEKNQFSYFLKNNDDNWSKWSLETKKEYTNLPAGNYSFMVKAKNIYDMEGNIASYNFTILPPWYQTTWAYILFSVLAVLFIWFVSLAYSYRIRMQRKRLKLIVADRTYEVISQKKEIESQNELLKEQFEQISTQKDEIQIKNTELQTSQEEILTINEKLKELNIYLERKVEQRTFKIKATLEELKRTNKELDTFVYRASHDLKGPISRIHGLASLGRLDPGNYYELIEQAAIDMQSLLSKLSNVHDIMTKEIYEDEIVMIDLIDEVRRSLKFLEQDTKYKIDMQEGLAFTSDKYLIKIIVQNLLENALIFKKQTNLHQHEVAINCKVEDGYFFIEVGDNGIGIAPEETDKIFEMFYRGSDQSKGSGLGLYIIKMILSKLEGSIKLESTLYEYAIFSVQIPLKN